MARPRRNDFLIPTLGVLFDAVGIEIAFLFSYWLRFQTSALTFLPLNEVVPPFHSYVYTSFIVIPVWLLLMNVRQMYGARRLVSVSEEFTNVIKAVTLGMLIVMSAAFFYRLFSYSRVVFVLLWAISIVTLILGRSALLAIERALYRRGRELRNVVIIGNGDIANRIFVTLSNHPLLGYRITGYFSDEPAQAETVLGSQQYLGTLREAPGCLSSLRVELALLALGYADHPKLMRLVEECEGINIEFLLVPDVINLMASGASMKEIEGIPFLKLKGVPMTTWGRILKRTFDIAVSSLILVLFSPIFLLIAIAIKLASPGPVFFSQDRVGVDGKRFRMVKFRSMTVGAERHDKDAGLGVPNDPRVTSIGKILRRTSLDEFPQLVNVLRGEMSLVGPRPERPYFVEQFKDNVPKYLDRHRMKTGMTGWAQVNGLRGDSSLEERIKYDIYYIENWSMGFDARILLKTVGALFASRKPAPTEKSPVTVLHEEEV